MKRSVQIPLRRKILWSLTLAITIVVSLITFTMASFFHQDKRAYINDWVSIAAVSTAHECQSLLVGYRQRLTLYSEIVLSESLDPDEKASMMQTLFDELPELVGMAMFQDGEQLETADDRAALEAAGLSAERLGQLRDPATLPLDRLVDGEAYIENATPSAELPAMRLAFARNIEEGQPPVVVSALLRLDELQRIGSRFRVFEITVADGQGIVLVHPDRTRVVQRQHAELRSAALDSRQAGLTLEYENDGTPMLGGFAGVDLGQLTVAVEIPKSAAYLASRELLGRLVVVALGLLLLASVAGLLGARKITRPVDQLAQATRRIGRGEFNVQVEVQSHDEMGALADSFNQMTGELRDRESQLEEAHGQLVQSEKMAAFGQLGAGIAHEVKNPLAGVLGCTQLSLMEVAEGTSVHENLTLIEKETTRCKEIIENLLRFARQEKTILEPTEVSLVARDAAAIVAHQLGMHQVRMHIEVADGLPLVQGNANQLQQVLINLLINAQQAMEGESGNVWISTSLQEDAVEICVRDDGSGMTEEVQRKLFEPFFTTKPTGQGTGLGMSVSIGIVQDHHGEISLDSEVGQGTTFRIRIPTMEEGVALAGLEAEVLDPLEREIPPADQRP